jgi:hypothetical protein
MRGGWLSAACRSTQTPVYCKSNAFNRSRQAALIRRPPTPILGCCISCGTAHVGGTASPDGSCLNPILNQHSHLLVAVAVAAADASPCGPQLAPTRFRLHVLSLLRLPPARLRHAPTPSSPAPAPVRSVRLCSPRSSREPPASRLDPRHSRQLRRVIPSALRPLTGPFAPSR